MDENKERYNIERYGKRDSGNAVRCTKSKSKKNYSHNVMFVGNKTDLQVQSAVDKKNLLYAEVSTGIIFIIKSNST